MEGLRVLPTSVDVSPLGGHKYFRGGKPPSGPGRERGWESVRSVAIEAEVAPVLCVYAQPESGVTSDPVLPYGFRGFLWEFCERAK